MSMTNPGPARVNGPKVNRITALASSVPISAVAVFAAVGIGVFVVLGILQRAVFPDWGLANLDSEVSIATLFAAALLWVTAFWWFLVAMTARPRSPATWVWVVLLAWLALDEGNAIHEKLERWLETDW